MLSLLTSLRPKVAIGVVLAWNVGFLISIGLNGGLGRFTSGPAAAVGALTCLVMAVLALGTAVSSDWQRVALRESADADAAGTALLVAGLILFVLGICLGFAALT